MILNLIVVCSLLGYSFGLAKIKHWPLEVTLLLAISIIISVLYLCAYLGYLHLGTDVIFSIGLLLLLLMPWFFAKLTPSFVFCLLIIFIFALFATHSWMHDWDDFGEWGPNAEAMFRNNGFIKMINFSIHKSFPPGSDLFYYLFTIFKNFSNSTLFFAQNVLVISPIALVFTDAKWKEWKPVLASFIFILIFMILAYDMHIGFKTGLDPDEAIGLLFGGVLLIYYRSQKQVGDFLVLLPIIGAFTLLKPHLIPFVLLLTFIFISDQLYQYLFDKQPSDSWWKLIQRLLMIFLLLTTALLIAFSWQNYLNQAQIKNDISNPINIHNAIQLFSASLTVLEKKVLSHYLQHIPQVIINFIPILVLVPISLSLIKSTKQRHRFALWQVILFMGLVAYLFSLLLMDLFSFIQLMNDIRMSLLRFVRIYLIGWCLLLFGVIFFNSQPLLKNISNKIQNFLVILSLIMIATLLIVWAWKIHDQKQVRTTFMFLKSVATEVNQRTKPVNSICIQNRGFPADRIIQLYYWLIPRKVKLLRNTNKNVSCDYVLLIDKLDTNQATNKGVVTAMSFALFQCINNQCL